jgi:serine/threonine-protein kinase
MGGADSRLAPAMHEGLMTLVGKTVGDGRYHLDRALGQGGMGAVFAGVEVATGREVAIKLMHPGLAEEDTAMKRFQREAEVATRLNHPHVIDVIAAGGGKGEPPFIAMELLEGASLSERLKKGESFTPERVVRIARQVLSAISAGHRIGVVHRDLKPGNVMLVPDGDGDGEIAKVVDYGVARLAMTEAMTQLTATGHVVGTPSYMAPEQAMGEPADARCDVYAVGAIMHRLLAGEPPYGRGKYVDLLKRMVVDERTRIHERVSGLGRLADVIERALAHDPEGRYQSADEMNDALAELDPQPATTIIAWQPPADIESLRLPPTEDALVVPPPAPKTPPTSERAPASRDPQPAPARRALPKWAVVLGLLVIAGAGSAATWVVIGQTEDERQATAGVEPEGVLPAVAPVEVDEADEASADAGRSADAEADAASEEPPRSVGSSNEPRARMVHGHRRAVIVVADGFQRGTGVANTMDEFHALNEALNRRANLTTCWPRSDPVPTLNRGVTLDVDFDGSGRVRAVRPRGVRHYPEFVRCARSRIVGLTFDDVEAGTAVFSFAIGYAR